MKTSQLRTIFLDFFKARGHKVVKSDSLLPAHDETILFSGAGMNQFKEYFLGLRTDLKRATSTQKCLRTGDLDRVGKTAYHHSFFEMMGNFSFGDYFKEEAITWAWELLTKELSLPKNKLFVSVHKRDDEARTIWQRKIGIPDELIARFGDHGNFWPDDAPKQGPNGPCGPCSEIFFDQGKDYPGAQKRGFWADDSSGRFAEIWNLVFTQYERCDGGELVPLKSKNIDTGLGLERLACVVQGKKTNFEIDIFEALLHYICDKRKKKLLPQDLASVYAIADHIRAVTVAITDGAHPSNDGRGYVVRKLIRRAAWQARELGFNQPLLAPMVPIVVQSLSDAYPELTQAAKSVQQTVSHEEERFRDTLDKGLALLAALIAKARKQKKRTLSGEDIFMLYDTYGFPEELTQTITADSKIKIDHQEFMRLFEAQRTRAKQASKLVDAIFTTPQTEKVFLQLPQTKFLGYETLTAQAKVIWAEQRGEDGSIALNETPFYPEGGGQVGDQGMIRSSCFEFQVLDTQRKERVILHVGKFVKGTAKVGDPCQTEVNRKLREATMRNHTGTHLLQAALRCVIGAHIRQVGSLVNAEKLRFDFTHGSALTEAQIKAIENWVNEAVLENKAVQVVHRDFDDATRDGALAFFGEKYGDKVRVIDVPGRSKELCGGTHCMRSGDIGAFVIIGESSVGSGVRRIEALTGLGAVAYAKDLQLKWSNLSAQLKVNPDQVMERIDKMQKRMRELEKKKPLLHASTQAFDAQSLVQNAKMVGKTRFITAIIPDADLTHLRHMADQIRSNAAHSVLALFTHRNSKVQMVVALSRDLSDSPLNARDLAQAVTEHLEGSAGGRKDFAQGGGSNVNGIEQAQNALRKLLQAKKM